MRKYRILRAVEQNWGLMGPGSWDKTIWDIYSDGSFSMRIQYIPLNASEILADSDEGISDSSKDAQILKQARIYSGFMSFSSYQKLLDYLSAEDWQGQQIDTQILDGSVWTFRYYDSEGHVVKSSGKAGAIYGHPILEDIARALPLHEI